MNAEYKEKTESVMRTLYSLEILLVSANSSNEQRQLRPVPEGRVGYSWLHDWTHGPLYLTLALGELERFQKKSNDNLCRTFDVSGCLKRRNMDELISNSENLKPL